MPLTIPNLDNRRYQDLRDEALARIPVYTPEWTNFNESDPGVTLIEVFAFMTENLLYRANYMPERNRLKFLSLLGMGLNPGSAAQGMVTFTNERGPLRTITLNNDLEVRAGAVPFRTETGLDVLPIETQIYYKRQVKRDPSLVAYYKQLYSSYDDPQISDFNDPPLYESVQFTPVVGTGLDLGVDTIDGSLWIALLARSADKPFTDDVLAQVRKAIENRTISLGIMPLLAQNSAELPPGGYQDPQTGSLLSYQIPIGETLKRERVRGVAHYRTLEAISSNNVLTEPGIVQITLPSAEQLVLWDNLDPLESGVGNFPPSLEDTSLNARLITWLKISSSAQVQARFQWVGINAVFINQQARIVNELLPDGTGAPDQVLVLSRTPVLPDSLRVTVTANNVSEDWKRINDLIEAGSEVPIPDPRLPPGTPPDLNKPVKVFQLDPESGHISFGDGTRGARPPFGAILRANYDYSMGRAGNVGVGSVNNSPVLPSGLKVNNPLPTWGGADRETVSDGEKQIPRFLQHRDRLVSTDDFLTITLRTPGVDIGRVEVLPAYSPEIPNMEPGGAPGAVTLMLIPKYDPIHPNAPMPDRLFLDAICRYLDPRRLVTTEVFLRPPTYHDLWVSIGINVVARVSMAQVTADVKTAVQAFLSPLPPPDSPQTAEAQPLYSTPTDPGSSNGWPLRKSVLRLELMAVVSRVPGVLLVKDLLLIRDDLTTQDEIPMDGLDLPRLVGVSVAVGDPLGVDQLPGLPAATTPTTSANKPFLPLPVVPEECD